MKNKHVTIKDKAETAEKRWITVTKNPAKCG